MDHNISVLMILCFVAVPSCRTRSVEEVFNQGTAVDSGPSKIKPEKDNPIDNNNEIPILFQMEGVGGSSTPPLITQPIELEESGLDKKVLGLPGWEYVMVSLVVVAAVGVGGSVAIVCKKCCGLAGKGVTKKSEGEGQIRTS
ncbi:uncharacterized protein LOC134281910 isoform X2 [Saccostrea cucullata]|uniref:uncharacterized protein LOC134281910 isoform X2 n=2 Tax=Saccostrea cuccullata TaxID=36930 RepID=UPI002ED2448A